MKSLQINDLSYSKELDREAMSGLYGGRWYDDVWSEIKKAAKWAVKNPHKWVPPLINWGRKHF